MTPHPAWWKPNTPLDEVPKLMAQNDCGEIPLIDPIDQCRSPKQVGDNLDRSLVEELRRHRGARRCQVQSAAVSSPHLCLLYDVGHHDGVEFLVMELLAGETLAARLSKGPLEIAEALACAIQIADAFNAAHRRASCTAI